MTEQVWVIYSSRRAWAWEWGSALPEAHGGLVGSLKSLIVLYCIVLHSTFLLKEGGWGWYVGEENKQTPLTEGTAAVEEK